MATPSIIHKAVLSYARDTGATAQVVNDGTEYSFSPTKGFTLQQHVLLAVGATNTAVALSADTALFMVEEVSGAAEGVLIRIGATSATAIRTQSLSSRPPSVETVGLASGVTLYLTNESVNQIDVAISTMTTVP